MSWVAAGIAAAGIIKSQTVDKNKENRERKLAASTQQYSPWTGLTANPIKEADPFGSALQYGATGAALKQNIQASNDMHDYLTKNPWASPKINYNMNAGGGGGSALGNNYNMMDF